MGYTSSHGPAGPWEDGVPWKECSVMEERMRFIVRLLEGEEMSFLCREFGISRKTGYKIFDRYRECGLEALTDRVRRPYRYGNQLPRPLRANTGNQRSRRKHLARFLHGIRPRIHRP